MDLAIGVMSGTSIDGVDAVLVDLDCAPPRRLARRSTPWPEPLATRLRDCASQTPVTADTVASLDAEAGAVFAAAVMRLIEDSGFSASDIAVIGCHGQTVAHLPDNGPPTTLQLGDANVIAERTGITTVNDFRRRDMAAGGQGAPLAPSFHAAVLTSSREDRAVLNLGGIANITVLPSDPARRQLGFDTGPANCLSDGWTAHHRGEPFDDEGRWAASAQPDTKLLDAMLADPYFNRPPPKSTGTQYFSAAWLDACCKATGVSDPDVVQATIVELTVSTVAHAIARWGGDPARLLVCGGGVRNAHLMRRLREALPMTVESTAGHGIPPQDMEGMAFAWLAWRTLHGLHGNLPDVTGAAGNRILGAIHPA
jgi:anhydro-N-acetylmuramic acid kinase